MQPDFSRFMDIEIINTHLHFENLSLLRETYDYMSSLKINALGIVSPARTGHVNCNPQAICFKAAFPETVYIMGGPDYTGIKESSKTAAKALGDQARLLRHIGFDGVKLLETKPTFAVKMPFGIDDPVYEEFFGFIEQEAMPIIWHVADPEEFWEADKVAASADNRGWNYATGGFPTKERLYEQTERVLSRHPALKVILAHFYFLSADLVRAERLLDRFKNVNLDITPGSEMYLNFSKHPEKTRDFFIRYQDRIVFGDDTTARHQCLDRSGIAAKMFFMRRFLETDELFEMPHADENFLYQPGRVTGIKLPKTVLKKIYAKNFTRLTGHPRPLDISKATEECRRIGDLLEREYEVERKQNFGQEAERFLSEISG